MEEVVTVKTANKQNWDKILVLASYLQSTQDFPRIKKSSGDRHWSASLKNKTKAANT